MAWAKPVKVGMVGDGWPIISRCFQDNTNSASFTIAGNSPTIKHARHPDGRLASFHFWDFSADVFEQASQPGLQYIVSNNTGLFLVFAIDALSAERSVQAVRRHPQIPIVVVIFGHSDGGALSARSGSGTGRTIESSSRDSLRAMGCCVVVYNDSAQLEEVIWSYVTTGTEGRPQPRSVPPAHASAAPLVPAHASISLAPAHASVSSAHLAQVHASVSSAPATNRGVTPTTSRGVALLSERGLGQLQQSREQQQGQLYGSSAGNPHLLSSTVGPTAHSGVQNNEYVTQLQMYNMPASHNANGRAAPSPRGDIMQGSRAAPSPRGISPRILGNTGLLPIRCKATLIQMFKRCVAA